MERYRFLPSGSGGWGIITMAILLAEAAVVCTKAWWLVVAVLRARSPWRGNPLDVIISDSEIYFPKVNQPNAGGPY